MNGDLHWWVKDKNKEAAAAVIDKNVSTRIPNEQVKQLNLLFSIKRSLNIYILQ